MEGEVFPTVWSAEPSGGRLLKYGLPFNCFAF